ncbi:MAG: TetR/AcrR family transcriptional regulator [Anaerolineae bacterium]|nr:TetR/AcrR family transcriptional regulator [Anaerolineae bacterium]MBT3714380.1 TetR/AcrR family transcriptional regulator [Anaerolineae bacterium]MBT4311168.1 TetR/AcrR family transcriptional regulator [Anaerolineae bacterium]MBT4458026.1 TetR/AcrR family transcriptional regulator [Anaerolineae bacterium]MBT4843703.1 TetR/AcrR family transcriptional regulator [Anaerolineae bacterium]
MARPKQSQQHPNLSKAIKDVAYQQMSKNGAAALSLRAIARELKITAPAIYNYFPSRDDLVTALIVDAYNSLRDALLASQETDEESHAKQIFASAHAYRNWALANAEKYSLLFGTPIPNYHAPMEITGPAAAGSMSVLLGTLDAAWRAGKLKTESAPPSTPDMIQAWVDKFSYDGDPAVIHLAMASWAQIHGMVSLELNGHFIAVPMNIDIDSFFEFEINIMIERMGMQ